MLTTSVAFLEDPKQGDLEHQAHASGVELVIGFVSFERHQGHTGAKIRPLPDINFKKAGFRIGFFPARLAQVIDDGQQQLRVVFPLLMVVFDVTAQDEQCAAQGGQEDVLVVVGADRNIVRHGDGFLAQQGTPSQLHKHEDATKLIQEIDAVLEVFPAFRFS